MMLERGFLLRLVPLACLSSGLDPLASTRKLTTSGKIEAGYLTQVNIPRNLGQPPPYVRT